MNLPRENRLNISVRFVLFVTSYSPLFILIIISQLSKFPNDLFCGNLKSEHIFLLLKYFGVSLALALLMTIGFFGLKIFLSAVDADIDSSSAGITIRDFENKNSESIGYIGTYIIPFLFSDYTNFYSVISLAVLLVVVYFIYIQSSLIVINPILNIFYSLYEVSFSDSSKNPKKGMLITREKYLAEGDNLQVIPIGHKLYFGKPKGGEHV